MGARLVIILAIIIIIISSTGILLTKNEYSQQEKQEFLKQQDVEAEVFLLVKDIQKGSKIKKTDIKLEKRKVKLDSIRDSLIVDKPLEYIINSHARFDLKADQLLNYNDVVMSTLTDEGNELSVSNEKDLSFRFPLKEREFSLIKNMKQGSYVDIYFRYQIKTKNTDTGIVTKTKEDSLQESKENANLSKFVLLFKEKRILNIVRNNQNGNTTDDSGTLVVQLNPDDIKTIYSIENLGNFYIFPTDEAGTNSVSTKKILSKDFIKEIRGGR